MLKVLKFVNKLNKKAQIEYSLIWLYRIIIIVIVVGGVIGIVLLHYSKQYDIRELEAAAITKKITDCLIMENVLDIERFVREKVLECIKIDEHSDSFLNISLGEGKEYIEFGYPFLFTLCQIKEKKVGGDYLPVCVESIYYVLKEDINSIGIEKTKLKIVVVIGKGEKNA